MRYATAKAWLRPGCYKLHNEPATTVAFRSSVMRIAAKSNADKVIGVEIPMAGVMKIAGQRWRGGRES